LLPAIKKLEQENLEGVRLGIHLRQ
jgi:hypothetical protein